MTDFPKRLGMNITWETASFDSIPVEHSFLPGTVAGLCEIMVAAAWRLKVSLKGGVRTVVAHTLSGSWEVSGPGSLDLRMMVGALFEVAAERQRGARA